MHWNLVKAAAKPWKAGKYIARAMPDLVAQHPAVVLAACRSAGIETVDLRYLDRYLVTLDTSAGIIATDTIATGSFQFDLFETVMSLLGRSVDLFVNVGANMGTTCLNAHRLGFRDFIAFEPVERNFALLERNLARNLADARIDCRKLALGNREHTAVMKLHGDNCGRHSLKDSFNAPASIVSEVTTEVRTLDSQAIGADCLLWVDTEGFELEVLQGGLQTLRGRCVALCVEVTPSVYSAADLAMLADILASTFSRFHDARGTSLTAPAASDAWRDGQQHDLICIA
jgi:FkbM family methyltransferase